LCVVKFANLPENLISLANLYGVEAFIPVISH
jgi:ABC-type transporter Mla MlaB component